MAYTTINKSSDYFDTKIYTQSGSSNNGDTQTITMDNVGFTWFKNRDYINAHALFDIVRGGDKLLATNGTGAEETVGGGITFGASDTTIGADTGGYGFNNRVGDDYVAWHWRTDGTSGSSNTDGSITSTVSANTTSGFSIIQYTGNSTSGATIGHGLGAVPKVYFCKKVNSSGDSWRMYTEMTGNQSQLALDQTSSADSGNTAMWNSTTPTSSVITLGNHTGVNGNTDTFIGYAFAEKKGFSKFGSYTGNGNADGTFIYTGFKPAFVIFKKTSATGNWGLLDSTRSYANVANHTLAANLSDAESSFGGGESVFGASNKVDIVSNGIKIREASDYNNASGATYIYLAFAESPIVSSNGVPAVAR